MSSDKPLTKKEKVTIVTAAVEDALLRSIGQVDLKPRKHTQEQIDAINKELAELTTSSDLQSTANRVHSYTDSVLSETRSFLAAQQAAREQEQKLNWEQKLEHRAILRKALEKAANKEHVGGNSK